MNVFIYALKQVYKRSKFYTVIYVLFSYIILFTSVLELMITQVLINSFCYNRGDYLVSSVQKYLILLIVLLYVGGLFTSLRGVSLTHLMECGLYEDDRMILEKTCKLTVLKLDSPEVKSLREKAIRVKMFDVVNMYIEFSTALLKILIFGAIIVYFKCYILLLVIFAILWLKSILQKKYSSKLEEVDRKQVESNRVIKYLYELIINRESLQEIKSYNNLSYLNDKKRDIFFDNYHERNNVVKKNEFKVFGMDSIVTTFNILSICLLAVLVGTINSSAGLFVVLMQIIGQMYGLLPSIAQMYGKITVNKIQFTDYREYINFEETETANVDTTEDVEGEPIEIKLDNVCFSYPDVGRQTLKNISIHIKPREKVALVGENGSGKSTLIKMMLGIYEPENGTVTWTQNGKRIEKPEAVSKMRVVFQDFIKLLRPVRENVAFGNILKLNDDEKIESIIAKAGNADLKNDLDQYIGPEFGGGDLSGGQWQKLCIARAYMKNAGLAFFDEATSALDPQTELEQYKNFFKLSEDITSVVVTHRLSVTKLVDKIYVISNGEIVEYGNHQELYDSNGVYRQMYDAQSAFYI